MATITITKDITWEEIQKAVDRGKADRFQPGQIVIDVLKDGREMPFAVAAVNHYQQDEIILVNKVSYGNHYIDESGQNACGWNGSELRKYANTEVFNLLPDDLQAVIAPRTIIESDQIFDKNIESNDKLWCLSPMEIGGSWIKAADNGEDKQFPYFENRVNRILLNDDGDRVYWWERSPDENGVHCFYCVGETGVPCFTGWTYGNAGMCFGFMIRKSSERE